MRPEPEVEELVATFETIPVRSMTGRTARQTLARAVLAAGYERKNAATKGAA